MNLAWSLGEGVSLSSWGKGVIEGFRGGPLTTQHTRRWSASATQPGETPWKMPEVLWIPQETYLGTCFISPGSANKEAGGGVRVTGPQGPPYT